jgi:hypothetical protein
MSFMTNEWFLSHQILNDYCSIQFIHNNFRVISHFLLYKLKYYSYTLIIYLKISINVTENPKFHEENKHIDIQVHFICEEAQANPMIGDIFTKSDALLSPLLNPLEGSTM